MAIIIWDW